MVMQVGDRCLVNLFFELKLVVVQQCGDSELADNFNERLSDANSTTSEERREAIWVSASSPRCQKVRALSIKSLGDEFFWFNPLIGIIAELNHKYTHHVSLTYPEFLTLNIFRHLDSRRIIYGWHHAKSFVEAVCIQLKISIILVIYQAENVSVLSLFFK